MKAALILQKVKLFDEPDQGPLKIAALDGSNSVPPSYPDDYDWRMAWDSKYLNQGKNHKFFDSTQRFPRQLEPDCLSSSSY